MASSAALSDQLKAIRVSLLPEVPKAINLPPPAKLSSELEAPRSYACCDSLLPLPHNASAKEADTGKAPLPAATVEPSALVKDTKLLFAFMYSGRSITGAVSCMLPK